ncbi:response regulator transcription factor [Mobilitalea sibirica]|uniref:Stage 0 sporulation protein A homolog n=1 Tax=Mobilitalea sibirica TaxID=1462919 RepID=A0A8J7H8Z0_9FIRM|nr:response regulator transcription factor [Mobilitalea sibirica]MBH1941746.1 response regulator transcription factor [Mobilitalea sibirica]
MPEYDCLIVDDEEALSQSTCDFFNMFGLKTYWVADEKACFDFFKHSSTDLILLDINLGQSSGFQICKRLRETMNIPILFISARTSDDDVLLALNIGGDDYIQKPYSLNILMTKVKTVLKRYRGNPENIIAFGEYKLDLALEKLISSKGEINLKAMEYRLLAYLVKNKGRTISKEELFQRVWGDAITGDGTLNVHIRRLREKIEVNPNEPRFIKTIWGTGYVFED